MLRCVEPRSEGASIEGCMLVLARGRPAAPACPPCRASTAPTDPAIGSVAVVASEVPRSRHTRGSIVVSLWPSSSQSVGTGTHSALGLPPMPAAPPFTAPILPRSRTVSGVRASSVPMPLAGSKSPELHALVRPTEAAPASSPASSAPRGATARTISAEGATREMLGCMEQDSEGIMRKGCVLAAACVRSAATC